ncbi:hypothetical protein BG006_007713 [Podila minutissima]|uniref:Uncharacterized protein n=1 Tax=Podila minutissima TaxID=64525 RepID=A0A9P5VRQ2_9FUNG|nr:hypothetical protein BG006_007713 [Podila minutissima]
MESHDYLAKLVAESHTPDRPEVRAKASIALVSFASEQTPATDDAPISLWLDAWVGILRGLGDEWPLVREAFQELLTRTLDHHKVSLVSQDEFLDQAIADAKDKKHSPLHKLQIAAGLLTLQEIVREPGNSAANASLPKAWSSARVDDIALLLFDGWPYIQDQESTRLGKLLAEQISSTRIIRALGSMAPHLELVSSNKNEFIKFCASVLGELSKAPQEESSSVSSSTKDWALALWISEQLRIPTVFVERPFIQESDENRITATNFVRNAYPLLQCIHYLVQIQPVNNTYTLHRLTIASASFTNPGDLWNTHDPLGTKIVHQAHKTLQAIIQHTPWSDTGAGQRRSTTHQIMIPGGLSDHVIQILQKEMRPCFVHARAQSIEKRAHATVMAHQDQVRWQLEQEKKGESQREGASDAVGVRDQTRSTGPRQRFQIAEVGDDANEVDEFHEALHRDSNPALGALSKRWDTHCLESVAVTEWCAQQPIQDVSRVQEVFMTLVGPILAMMDSNQDRFRARGLNLLCRFLIQQLLRQKPGARATASDSLSRIWIRIFEKTGLDQALIRGIVPLIAPLNVMITEKPLDPMEVLLDSKEFVQDTVSAALRAFFTLIVVNTEPEDRPPSMEDATTPLRSRQLYQASQDEPSGLYPLTIEELFIKGVLGSFRRTSPSKEYRALILRWMQILVQPVVSLGFLVHELENEYFKFGRKDSEKEEEEEKEEESKRDRGKELRGVYGLGPLATKYLPALVTYLADVLDLPFPSSPIQERIESLEMAWRASEALCSVIQVSRARIPRYRGRILAAIANCWANSRIFEISTPQENSKERENLAQMQKCLDSSLVQAMQLYTEACRNPLSTRAKVTAVDALEGEEHSADETEVSGLDLDLKVLKDLDPSVFGPLFQ